LGEREERHGAGEVEGDRWCGAVKIGQRKKEVGGGFG